MSVWRLLLCEIRYRKGNFLLAVLSVVVAVGCVTATLTLLRLHDQATERIIEAKEQETRSRVAGLESVTQGVWPTSRPAPGTASASWKTTIARSP